YADQRRPDICCASVFFVFPWLARCRRHESSQALCSRRDARSNVGTTPSPPPCPVLCASAQHRRTPPLRVARPSLPLPQLAARPGASVGRPPPPPRRCSRPI